MSRDEPPAERLRERDERHPLVVPVLEQQQPARIQVLAREYERAQGLFGPQWPIDEAMLAYLMHRGAPAAEIADRYERMGAQPGAPPFCPALVRALRSPERARAILRELLDSLSKTAPSATYEVALLAAYLGDHELAVDALRVFKETRSPAFQNVWYPLLADVRKDPRFKDIIRGTGLVDFWRKTGQWSDFCRPLGADDFECF